MSFLLALPARKDLSRQLETPRSNNHQSNAGADPPAIQGEDCSAGKSTAASRMNTHNNHNNAGEIIQGRRTHSSVDPLKP